MREYYIISPLFFYQLGNETFRNFAGNLINLND